MSHLDELDEFEAELELRLKREYTAVFGLFRYCVLTQDATYLCNRLDMQYVPQPNYPFFHLKMEDVWVWDKNRPTRMIPRAEVCAERIQEVMTTESSVAVAIAPGTPGIGKVKIAFSPCHVMVVVDFAPAAIWRSNSTAGFWPNDSDGGRPTAAAMAAFGAPCGLAHRRISRSSRVAGFGVALPLPGTSSAPGMSSSHAYSPFTTSTFLYVWPLARLHSICVRQPGTW